MAQRILPMERRDIIRRLKLGQGIREIKRETGKCKQSIRMLRDTAVARGWMDQPELPSEEEIRRTMDALFEERSHQLDQIRDLLKTWKETGYTYVVMTRLANKRLKSEYNEITVRRYVQRHLRLQPTAVIRRDFAPGEVAEVDFGFMGLMTVPGEVRPKKVWLFSLRPCFSRKPYRELVLDQEAQTFFRCHMNGFEYFGGVFEKIVCDNLKAAVIKASMTDPLVNRSYRMLAEHYGFLINPCLPGHPEHKGGVERDVQYVKKSFLPEFLEEQREKGLEIPDYLEAKGSLRKWEREIDDVHEVKYIGQTPVELFKQEEAFLKPMPAGRWDPVEWRVSVVGDDWRIQVLKGFYSVPYELIGQRVHVCLNSVQVTIYRDFKPIAVHPRVRKPWGKSILAEHGPKRYQEFLQMTSEGTRKWAAFLGPNVVEVVTRLLARKGVDGLRPARNICGLAKKFGRERLDAACRRALEWDTLNYQSIRNILEKHLAEEKPVKQEESFRFSRASDFAKL